MLHTRAKKSYCGVNTHLQNLIEEKRIRYLKEQARKQILHAKSRWISAIELNMWPYMLRNANKIREKLTWQGKSYPTIR